MSTPLAPYSNATLTIPIETYGEWSEDTLDYSKVTIELVYKILINTVGKPGSSQNTFNNASSGIDIETSLMKGRVLEPQHFDSRIKFPITGKVHLIREERDGTMELVLVPQSPYYPEAETLGEAFIGKFKYS